MPTIEADIAKQQASERVVRMLEKQVKCFLPTYLVCSAKPTSRLDRYWAAWENGVRSISMFPCDSAPRIRFKVPSNAQAIENDWKAVGHDLYASILQYTIAENYCHGRSSAENDSAHDHDWTVSSR